MKILATDLDSDVLAKARAASTPPTACAASARSAGAILRGKRGRERRVVRSDCRATALITFKQLNLMHPLPMKGPLDAIFCRNVVIYFDKDTQRELFSRVAPLQRPGDMLFLGHSESMFKVSESYTPIGKTIYRRA